MSRTFSLPRSLTLSAAALVLLLVSCNDAFAQLTTATLTGTVHDTSGASIPGATLT